MTVSTVPDTPAINLVSSPLRLLLILLLIHLSMIRPVPFHNYDIITSDRTSCLIRGCCISILRKFRLKLQWHKSFFYKLKSLYWHFFTVTNPDSDFICFPNFLGRLRWKNFSSQNFWSPHQTFCHVSRNSWCDGTHWLLLLQKLCTNRFIIWHKVVRLCVLHRVARY